MKPGTAVAALSALIVLGTSAAAPGEDDEGRRREELAKIAFPAEPTPVPEPTEWEPSASIVFLSRGHAEGVHCIPYRIREWFRIRCTDKLFAWSMLGGSTVGLAFWVGKDKEAEVVFPVRRGDRRVIQAWIAGTDEQGQFQPKPFFVIQEQWVEGERAPIIILQ